MKLRPSLPPSGELHPTVGTVRPHMHLRMAKFTQHFEVTSRENGRARSLSLSLSLGDEA